MILRFILVLVSMTLIYAADASAENQPIILVVRLSGDLEVKRPPATAAFIARVGTILRPGDVLWLRSGAATVTCADLTTHELQQGLASAVPCQSQNETIVFNKREIVATRADIGFVPVVLSPRRSKLLTSRPRLQWRRAPGATAYVLAIVGGDLKWSKTVEKVDPIDYPRDAPTLKPGIPYKFTVIGKDISPDHDETPDLGFSIATDEEQRAVKMMRSKVTTMQLNSQMTQLVDALVLSQQGFYAEAIDELEHLAKSDGGALEQRLLSDNYLAVGLYSDALRAILKAHDLYLTSGDKYETAESSFAAGELFRALGNPDRAAALLREAKNLFDELHLDQQSKHVQTSLDRLENVVPE